MTQKIPKIFTGKQALSTKHGGAVKHYQPMGKRNLDPVPASQQQQSCDILLTTDGNASDSERKEERKAGGK